MKRIIIFFCIAFLSIEMQAQVLTPIAMSFDDYVGTWKYENKETKEEFIIKFKKINYQYREGGEIKEKVVGTYSYSRNGEYLVNILDSINTIRREAIYWPIVVSRPTCDEKNWFGNMWFSDYLVFVICEGSKKYKDYLGSIITPVEGRKRRLKMIIRDGEGVYCKIYNSGDVISKEEGQFFGGYIKGESSIPKEMILEKVE